MGSGSSKGNMTLMSDGNELIEYDVSVSTGKNYLGSTNSPVHITLFGTNNPFQTRSVLLDNKLRDDFQSGSINSFAIIAENVGDVIGIKIHHDCEKSGFGLDAAWDLNEIIISLRSSSRNEHYIFACNCWMENLPRYFLRNDLGMIKNGQSEVITKFRQHLVESHRQLWPLNNDPNFDFPIRSSYTEMTDLPLDHQYTPDRLVSFGLAGLESQVNRYFSESVGSMVDFFDAFKIKVPYFDTVDVKEDNHIQRKEKTGNEDLFDHINQYRSPQLFASLSCPSQADRWRSDAEFGDRMVSGAHPICLKCIYSIPVGFNLSDTIITSMMPANTDFNDLLQSGQIFYIDHGPALKDVPLWDGSKANGEDLNPNRRYCPPAKCMFFVHPNINGRKRLMPLAIQLLEGEDAEVFTPLDSELDWLVAKTFFMVADSNVHQMVSHLFSTHILIEPFIIALERQVPRVHPVFKLLHNHLIGTVAINTYYGRKILVGAGGIGDILLSTGGGGHMEIMSNYYKNGFQGTGNGLDFFTRFNHRKFSEYRGINDPTKLPHYPYRDDANVMWDAIETYVTEFLSLHYKSESDLINDDNLQDWINELSSNCLQRLIDFPNKIIELNQLIEILTIIIFQVSCGHASVNFSQYDHYSHIPSAPLCSLKSPPTKKNVWTMDDFMDMLPSAGLSRQQILTVFTLSEFNDTEEFLFDNKNSFKRKIFDEKESEVVKNFKQNLEKIDLVMKQRAESGLCNLEVSGDAYQYLRPSRVPCSIAV
eukprot:gene11995-16058_t